MREKFVLCILFFLIICNFLFFITNCVEANRKPEITNNLSGLPISCSIYTDQASLAEIHADDPLNKVIAILGKPLRSGVSDESYITYYYSGLTIGLKKWDSDSPYTVVDMEAHYGGKAVTLDGVGVGMSEKVLSKIYGTADEICIEQTYSPKLSKEQNEQIRKRINRKTYTYNAHPLLYMSFKVNNGIINKIIIHRAD